MIERNEREEGGVHFAPDGDGGSEGRVLDHTDSLSFTSKHPARAPVTQTYNKVTVGGSVWQIKPYRQPQRQADCHLASRMELL